MADKAISELVAATQITATDMFVLEQNGTAKRLTGQVLLNWLTAAADGHGGIHSIEKIATVGLNKTFRITMADTTTFDFVVTDGRGISRIAKTSTSGLVDTYTITYNDGSTSTYTVTNGAKGDKGDNTYLWIKYASQKPTAASHSFGDVPDTWIGIYFGNLSEAPTDWQQYNWYNWKGEQGNTGAPATLVSGEVRYQVGDSGTIIPSGAWLENVPIVAQGKYLWTRIVQTFNTGDPVTSYTVSRMGIDGLGSVVSVAGVSPDPDGNVPLTADAVKALSIFGGTMAGSINMNGQKLNGLNEPTESDEAANKGYVDKVRNLILSPKTLWSGSWESGELTVEGLSGYKLCAIGLSGQGTGVIALRIGNHLRGIGGYSSATPTITIYNFAATVSGDTLTFIASNSMQHIQGEGHSVTTDTVVASITGLC